MSKRPRGADGGPRLRLVGADDAAPTGATSSGTPPRPDEDSNAELDDLLGQLFEAFAVGIARVRWPLAAELHASEVLGALETTLAQEGPVPAEALDTAFEFLFAGLVQCAEQQCTPAALAVLRTLAVFADEAYRGEVVAAADRLAAAGVTDPVWAKAIGSPAVERCWRYGDVFGSQESIHMVFAYGRRRHALAVLVDHELGGGVKDSWVSDDPDRLWRATRRDAESNPVADLEEISWHEAREALLDAAAHDPCPVSPDQVEDVARHAHLLAARLALPADDGAPADGEEGAAQPSLAARAAPPPASATSGKRSRRPSEVLQLKVSLKGSKPPIWRRLEVPVDITLDRLHEVLMVAFGWHGGHLHVFEADDRAYGDPDPELGHVAERGVRLARVAPVGAKLLYTYDFGDDWQHVIVIEKILPAQDGVAYPRCTGGRRAAPPDDCGGIWGYQDLLDVLADPTHVDHESALEWLGSTWGSGPGGIAALDPAYFRAADVTEALARLGR